MLVISRYDRGGDSEAPVRYLILFLLIYQRLQALEKPGRMLLSVYAKSGFYWVLQIQGKEEC